MQFRIPSTFRDCLSFLPALNTGMTRGGTEIRRSFCGSYPSKALLSERLNVPKSEMVTFFPSTRASEIMVVKRLIVLAAADLEIPAFLCELLGQIFFESRLIVGCNHENSEGGE